MPSEDAPHRWSETSRVNKRTQRYNPQNQENYCLFDFHKCNLIIRRYFASEVMCFRVRHISDTETPPRPPLSPSQIRELKAAFTMLDKNRDGRVNEMEIKCMLDKLGIVLTDTMVGKLIGQASKRGDGLLNEEEFLSWMARQSVQDDIMADLMAAFRVFDKDRNGYISKDELRMAMEVISEPMSEDQLDVMLKATDIDNDGKINYEEFVRMLL